MSKSMSASVCAFPGCTERLGKEIKAPQLKRLCPKTHRPQARKLYKLGNRDDLTDEQFNEFVGLNTVKPTNATNDSITESATSINVQEAQITADIPAPVIPSTVGFSSDDDTKHIHEMIAVNSVPVDNSSNNNSVCTDCSSDTGDNASESISSDTSDSNVNDTPVNDTVKPVLENNGIEMNTSNDSTINAAVKESSSAPVPVDSVNETTSIEEPSKTTSPSVSDQRKVLQMFHITGKNGVFLYDYSLNDKKSKDSVRTGIGFNLCTSEYAVIDITFKDSCSGDVWKAVSKDISAINGTRIVDTGIGFQLYCKYDKSWDDKHKNRFDREYCCEDYYISIYTPLTVKDCTSNLMAIPFSLFEIWGEEEPFKYTIVKACIDESLLSFTDLLKTVLAFPHASIVKDNAVKLHCSSDDSDNDFGDDQIDAKPVFSSDSSDSDSDEEESVPVKQTTKPLTKNDMINDLLGIDTNGSAVSVVKDTDDESSKAIDTSGKVLWYNCANVSNAKDKMLIAHKDVTPDLIKRGFYEIVGKHIIAGDKVYTQRYTRLFFDFDIATHKDTLSLYNKELVPRFDKLKSLFGDYSISAYSNNESVATAVGCNHNGKASKELSLHIVFYESRLTIDDLYALTREQKFNFPDGWDFSVYEILKRRVFRHHGGPHTGYGIKCIGEDGLPVFKPPFQLKKDGKPLVNTDGSPKMSKPDKYCPGSIIGNKPLHTQLLQPIGTEKVITMDEVLKSGVWFDMKEGITKDDINVKVSKRLIGAYVSSDYSAKLVDTKTLNAILQKVKADTVDNDNDASIDYISNVNCFKYLLNCFTPDFVNLQHVFWLVIVCGPYKKDTLKEIVHEWYWKGEHSTPDGDADYIDCNYVNAGREYSDMWFYGAIKHLPAALKDAFIAKYAIRSVNTAVKFDVWDDFTLNNLQQKIINNEYVSYGDKTVYDKSARKKALNLGNKYKLKKLKDDDGAVRAVQIQEFPYIKFGDILTDLRRCLAIINETPMAYIFKDVNGATGKNVTSRTTHAAIARDKLKHIVIKYIANDITFKSVDLWTLLQSNNNSSYITYPAAEFYSTIPNVFSYYYPAFQRCVYDTVDTTITDYHKMNNLERWIHHVNNVICDGDETAIQYVHSWIARPLQNPLQKNKTALIIKGRCQGTGKSWFAEIVARLHGKFGAENIGDMKNICGNFNAIIDNKTLILVNEVPNIDNSKYYDDDRLKGLISDDKTEIEYKGENSVVRDIYANFIFVSNNETPIRITDNDRRYVVLRPSEAHATINGVQDSDYWTPAFYYLKEDNEFLAQLYSYYMNFDVKYYNPANIPKTLALAEIIEQSRPRIHDFIIDNYKLFVKGWEMKCAFLDYLEWAKSANYTNPGHKDTFRNNLRDYVVWVKTYPNGKSKPPALKLPQQKLNGKPVYVYKLTEQYVEYFKPSDDNVIIGDCEHEPSKDDIVNEILEE